MPNTDDTPITLYRSTLKTEAVCASETLVTSHQTTGKRHHYQDDHDPQRISSVDYHIQHIHNCNK